MTLGNDEKGAYVTGLDQLFRSKAELKKLGYAFAFKYGSANLAKAMAHLPETY
jgi:hypothetical protein